MFKAERVIAIPNKDILSWTFDDNQFDQDEPVSHMYSIYNRRLEIRTDQILRDMLMLKIQSDRSRSDKLDL